MAKTEEFTDEDKQRALQMYRDDIAVTKICNAVGCSRTTFYNWKNSGELTDGTPWDEWLENHEQFEVAYIGNEKLETSVENSDEFWEENIPKLRRAIQRTINKMAEGELILGPDELETIVGLVRRVENRGKELRMMHEEFMRKVMFALRETEGIDQHKFELIKEKMKQASLEQLKEIDDDYAEILIESSV